MLIGYQVNILSLQKQTRCMDKQIWITVLTPNLLDSTCNDRDGNQHYG